LTLLSIRNLTTVFHSREGGIKACNQINLDVEAGKVVGLIGETGCGKSVLGMSILRLLPDNTTITGNIFYRDRDLLEFSKKQLIGIRGKEIGLLPQSPSTSLNPVLKIGEQISEGLRIHKNLNRSIAWQKTLEILQLLGLPSAEKRINAYPHQLSGGMKQRILAAISITGQPSLLIADEPTKGLDAVLRAQVVGILRRMIRETGASLLLITHDLKVAARLCDDIVVMYAGEIVERAPAAHLLARSRHPYTQGLLASMPEGGLRPIPGHSPSLLDQSVGCNFYQRCRRKQEICNRKTISGQMVDGSFVRCLYAAQGGETQQDLYNRNIQSKAI